MTTTNQKSQGLGITGWDVFEFIVGDLERSRRFYTDMMDIPEVARFDERFAAERGEAATLFQAGQAAVACITPGERGSRAERWLRRHPDGIAVMAVRVRDLEHARRLLEQRGATFCSPIVAEESHDGTPSHRFDIATPMGDVRMRFVERPQGALPPGFVPLDPSGVTARNRHSFEVVDHVTSNFLTIEPFVSWLRDVMGFEEYWRVHFHTSDAKGGETGSGLASIVMWDPESGIKLANNEPAAPNYEASQIYAFVDANHGAGVQHIAFHVPSILPTVEGLRKSGIEFLDTPATYYDMLPERLAKQKVSNFEEKIDDLRSRGILVDGADSRYLLQIFMVEGGLLYDDDKAGPFFYEVIQRKGAKGFGEGNFRALFEAIERDQEQRRVAEAQLRAGAGS